MLKYLLRVMNDDLSSAIPTEVDWNVTGTPVLDLVTTLDFTYSLHLHGTPDIVLPTYLVREGRPQHTDATPFHPSCRPPISLGKPRATDLQGHHQRLLRAAPSGRRYLGDRQDLRDHTVPAATRLYRGTTGEATAMTGRAVQSQLPGRNLPTLPPWSSARLPGDLPQFTSARSLLDKLAAAGHRLEQKEAGRHPTIAWGRAASIGGRVSTTPSTYRGGPRPVRKLTARCWSNLGGAVEESTASARPLALPKEDEKTASRHQTARSPA